jgi:lipoprotein-anchoring transpeptidase ErfK/SrfK
MSRVLLPAAVLATALAFCVPGRAEQPLVARVDVPSQTMQVIRYGEVLYTWRVSTARRGYVTPAGSWRPKRMHKMWYSRKYDMSPMPYAVFYDGGYAVHGTSAVSRLGTPASHGCVRLETANARIFYELVREIGPGNTRVVVVHEPSEPATADTLPDGELRLTTREG